MWGRLGLSPLPRPQGGVSGPSGAGWVVLAHAMSSGHAPQPSLPMSPAALCQVLWLLVWCWPVPAQARVPVESSPDNCPGRPLGLAF